MKCWDFVIVRNLPRKNQSPGITGCSQLMKTVFASVTELILPGWLVETPILDHDNHNLYEIHTPYLPIIRSIWHRQIKIKLHQIYKSYLFNQTVGAIYSG